MQIIHRTLLSAVIAFAPTVASTQPANAVTWADSARVAIESAAIAGDAPRLHAARALVERALVAYPNDGLLLHYQGYALYREASQLVGRQQMAEAAPLLAQAATVLERSEQQRPMPETLALLAMIYGQQIAADPSKAMSLGMLSGQTMGEAAGMGAANPRVWLLRGMTAMYTPPEYGGGLPVAADHLTKAIALYKLDFPAPGMPAWGRAEAHAWLGQVRQRSGDTAQAVAEYRQALALAPDYSWVKNVLLPPLTK